MNFTYANSAQIFFGQGQIASVATAIDADAKVLVIYGGGSIKKNGVYDQVKEALSGHKWIEFSGVEPNPTVETLDKAVALAKSENVDFILAVGGGSVIDGSKYVAAAALYAGEGWDILERKYQVEKAIPIGAILTLPATGSETNMGAVVTKSATQTKLSFLSPAVLPRFAVLDPDVMKTLPERQLVNGLVDAWVHICEQYLTSPQGAMVQDGYAEALLKNLLVLAADFDNRDNDSWRANLMWTANQALNGLIGSGVSQDWSTHMIGHELTAMFGVDHARSLAIIQPSLMRNQIKYKKAKLEQMAVNVFGLSEGEDLSEACIQAIEAFYNGLDVQTSFADYEGTKDEAVDAVIAKLQGNGMLVIGENQSIDIATSRAIVAQAFA
ncbi:iron-containing alcohol dehydrogenase [Alginatibacterium sediminis]|uniref:Iron-containing alcohol dehydrogenase n=1 Tax=Alginatibacterium sediminis TaxID=2164068 RepID=A0A420EHD6_9ALTE|nr:iron-containing alcohol dehydrogenase [Alginatibacterium sediminis]RKF20074.1 iron-containing alcohol dehydrogenase [Alginatibacterium sediminis]